MDLDTCLHNVVWGDPLVLPEISRFRSPGCRLMAAAAAAAAAVAAAAAATGAAAALDTGCYSRALLQVAGADGLAVYLYRHIVV